MREKTWYWRLWWFLAYNFGLYKIGNAFKRWRDAHKKLGKAQAKATAATVSFTHVMEPLVMQMPEPKGAKIQILRQITKRTPGFREIKYKAPTLNKDTKRFEWGEKTARVPWLELKTWTEWQTVELVQMRPRSVIVRYPDGREVNVKKNRTKEAT